MRVGSIALVAVLLGAGPTGVQAEALRVSPVSFDLQAGQRAATLSVRDDGETAMNVQVRVFRWSQDQVEDRLTPTDDLFTSPPFAALDPGAEQTIRLVRAETPPSSRMQEQAFRILVDELPPTGDTAGSVVRLLMRHSVPVFISPSVPARAEMTWSTAVSAQSIRVTGSNRGGRHIRLANLRVTDAQGRVLAVQGGLVGYVLAGSTMRFDIPQVAGAASAAPARLKADTEAGPIDVAIASGV